MSTTDERSESLTPCAFRAQERPGPQEPGEEALKTRRKTLLANTILALLHLDRAASLVEAVEALHGMEGADPDELALVDEVKVEIQQLLACLPLHALVRLHESQPANVALANLRVARRVLSSVGFPEGRLTDADIRQILGYRHLLLELLE